VEKVKVLVANRPRLLLDSIANLIRRQNDMEVVGEVSDPTPIELLLATNEAQPDVVIVDLLEAEEEPGICSHLLAENPRILILALSSEFERAFLYCQSVSRERLYTVSNEEILAAIRRWA
jgi:DNA-binding NarL/FixJ family response regulator